MPKGWVHELKYLIEIPIPSGLPLGLYVDRGT